MIPHTEGADAATRWWHSLQPDPARGYPGDRGALARLRRCSTVAQAMNEPAAIDLFRRLGADRPADLVRVALAAAVLAGVRSDDSRHRVARLVGPPDRADDAAAALMKPSRFGRLMNAATPDERLTAMRRLVTLADAKLNVRDLAEALLFWTEERRRRWVYDYWTAEPPRPLSPDPAASAAPAEDPVA